MSENHRIYGMRADQIHPFFREKREWSKVKDRILKDYITCYLRTIHRRGRPIIIVDAFSGPGRFDDGLEGSPLIICDAIDNAPKRGVGSLASFRIRIPLTGMRSKPAWRPTSRTALQQSHWPISRRSFRER